jgi:hypothetical protein
MSLFRDAGRKRLRLAAVLVVVIVAAGVGYGVMSTPRTYLESATVVFSLPKSATSPNAYYKFAVSGITSGEAMTQILMSPQAQRRIRRAGGTASVNLALVNLYNEEYPDYGVPLATLTVASPSAENVHITFMIAARRLSSLLTARQAKVGVNPRNRISTQIIADTGPILQSGSPKRAFGGLIILALVAVAALWSRIDRRVPGVPRRDFWLDARDVDGGRASG